MYVTGLSGNRFLRFFGGAEGGAPDMVCMRRRDWAVWPKAALNELISLHNLDKGRENRQSSRETRKLGRRLLPRAISCIFTLRGAG